MIHRVAGKKLGRNTKQRRALFRSLANNLILHEKIVTTEAKAKAVKPLVEKLITKAKTDSIHNRRLLIKKLALNNSVKKMLEVIGPKFKDRQGGYTKIVRIGSRFGDKAPLVALTFVEEVSSLVVAEKRNLEKTKEIKISTRKEESPIKTKKRSAKRIVAKKEENGKEST